MEAATQQPAFTQNFPDLMFDPFSGTLSPHGLLQPRAQVSPSGDPVSTSRSFTDLVLDPTGSSEGTIIVQGAGLQAGVGTLLGFSAVFRGNLVVAQAGSYTFNVGSADGFIFGIGNGAVRVSGISVNPPVSGTTVFSQYPVMGVNNGPSTGASAPIVVSFPAPGSYSYEFDYKSGTGGPLSLGVTVTQGRTTVGLRPLDKLLLTSVGGGTQIVGNTASFTVQANDETGAPLAQLPVNVNIAGANLQILTATTDNTGKAALSYKAIVAGTDTLQATAGSGP